MLSAYFQLMRLHRPMPILLLLWPTYWALWVAKQGVPSFKLLIIFAIGVFLMRSAGCVFNDIADRNFDGEVARTKQRPIATGLISVRKALILGLALCLMAFVLVLFLNTLTISLSFVAVALAIVYPLCKRFFSLPQLVLGFAFNFGVVMAFSATVGSVPWSAWLLYAGAIIWTLGYDTIYALADLPYDKKIGLKSTAVLFAGRVIPMIILLQFVTTCMLAWFGYVEGFNLIYYISLAITLLFYGYQFSLYQSHDMVCSIKAFSNNHWVGLVIFMGIVFQYPLL
jgi:4-hydroxybenzoate polyprenyltransferase